MSDSTQVDLPVPTNETTESKAKQESKFIRRLLKSMEKWDASDLFINEGKQPAVRANGRIVNLDLPITTSENINAFFSQLLRPELQQKFDELGDLDVGYSLTPEKRFRFNLSKQKGAVSMVIRALPSGELLFGQLGLPDAVVPLSEQPRGLVLITGATGSGKSTTVAAIIHYINMTRSKHIVTIEDPIEFIHRDHSCRISQREVGSDTHSFHSALRHVVRQSPDIIVIGEMRDQETIQVALSAALTGHLVLATLHTINTTQTLQRIFGYFPEHMRGQIALDLSMSLKGIISQRLIPTKDNSGRALAVEVLTNTPPASRLIREQRVEELEDLMRSSNSPELITFNSSLLDLFKEGKISFETGKAYATNPDEFALAAQGMSTGVSGFIEDGRKDNASQMDMKVLLEITMNRGASDLHLSVGRPPILRVTGELEPLPTKPLTAADLRLLLYSILTTRQRSVYELEREIDFALALDNGKRFRVNAYYHKGNMAAALRAIPSDIPDSNELGLPEVLLQLGQRPHGLLLIVGPTGSGKTTTMACLIDRINKTRSCRIITVEDPIEYTHDSILATVDQREVFADTQSFPAALKYVLRQDPDVILIGELRDLETISAALTAAETGHLVMATLHTNDAVQTIDRIIDVFPAHQQPQVRSQLASSLLGVISQRLMVRKGGKNRIACFEIMVGTPAIRNLIREGKMHQALGVMETSFTNGMITLDHSIKALYEMEMITYQTALQYIRNPSVLESDDRK